MPNLGSKLEEAASLYQRGQSARAKSLYEDVLLADPTNFVALHSLGMIMYLQGNHAEARALIEKALGRNPRSAEAHTHLGIVLQALGHPGEALVSYGRALAIRPDYVGALSNRGNTLLALRRLEEAVESYNRSLAVRPKSAETLLNRASALLGLGRAKEALKDCDRALALKPAFAAAFYSRCAALLELGRSEEVLASCNRALAIRPQYAEALCARGNALLNLKRIEEAVTSYDRALAVRPNYIEALCNRGICLQQLGQAGAALTSYDRALEIEPNFTKAMYNRTKALMKLKRFNEALDCCERVLATRPDFATAHNDRGNILVELDRVDEALASYDKALRITPDDPEVIYNRGWTLGALGRTSEALEYIERAIALDPRKPRFYFTLSAFRRHKVEESHISAMKGLLSDATSISKQDQAELHYTLGKVFEGANVFPEAFYHFNTGAALKRQLITYNETAELTKLEQIKSVFDARFVQRVESVGFSSQVPIFVVGMPRSGSTLVEQVLASHPRAFGIGECPDFPRMAQGITASGKAFPQSAALMTNDALSQLGEDYTTLIRSKAPGAAKIVDKQLANFMFLGIIHLALPSARIIHTIREPVDTCWSCFSTLFVEGQEFSYNLGEIGRYYRAYQALMQHWRNVLPKGVMLDVHYEELVADFDRQVRRILAHCGLEWDEACVAFYAARRPVRTASMIQVRQPVYNTSVGRGARYAGQLQPLLEALTDMTD